MAELAKGFIKKLYDGKYDSNQTVPSNDVQIIRIMDKSDTTCEWIISDSIHFVTVDCNSKVAKLYFNGEIRVNDIIQINSFFRKDGNTIVLMHVNRNAHSEVAIGKPIDVRKTSSMGVNYEQEVPREYGGSGGYNNNSGSNYPSSYSGGSSMLDLDDSMAQPISTLEGGQDDFVLKVRVLEKSDVRQYGQNSDKPGKLMSMELMDEFRSQIRAVLFNEAVDNYERSISVGNVYLLAGGKVKYVSEKYKKYRTNNNPLEISFGKNLKLKQVHDDGSINKYGFKFVPFSKLTQLDKDKLIDVIGIVEEAGDISMINTKRGSQVEKRNVIISNFDNNDPSEVLKVTLTLWGQKCRDYNIKNGDIICIKNVRTSDFGGISLSSTFQTNIVINPNDVQQSARLIKWKREKGSNTKEKVLTVVGGGSLTQYDTLSDCKKAELFKIGQKVGFGSGVKFLKLIERFCFAFPQGNEKLFHDSRMRRLRSLRDEKNHEGIIEVFENVDEREKKLLESGVFEFEVKEKLMMNLMFITSYEALKKDGIEDKIFLMVNDLERGGNIKEGLQLLEKFIVKYPKLKPKVVEEVEKLDNVEDLDNRLDFVNKQLMGFEKEKILLLKKVLNVYKKKEIEQKKVCTCPMCKKKTKERAFVPCGHSFCSECVKNNVKKCPICLKRIGNVIKIYF